MQRTEFLIALQEALEGEMPASEVAGNVQYYKDYIESESAAKGEEAVLQELGDPRLIAKTIIDTYKAANEEGSTYGYDSGTYYDNQYTRNDSQDDGVAINVNGKNIRIPKWGGYVVAAVVIALVIMILILLGKIAFAVLKVLLPVILVLAVFRWLFGRKR